MTLIRAIRESKELSMCLRGRLEWKTPYPL